MINLIFYYIISINLTIFDKIGIPHIMQEKSVVIIYHLLYIRATLPIHAYCNYY